MNPRNSIWYDVLTLNSYVARCQSVLQAGRSDNDILLYWPISDLWNNPHGMLPDMTVSDTAWFSNQPIGATALALWDHGYSFDYISDRELRTAKALNGKVRVPGGTYRLVLSPPCHLIPLQTLRHLIALAKDGATVIFESKLPDDVPGRGRLEERRSELKRLLAQIHTVSVGKNLQEANIGRGRIPVGNGEAALKRAGVTREPMVDHAGVFFIRRIFPGGWSYFIADRHGTPLNGWVTLGCPARSVVMMDPMTGRTGLAAVRHEDGKTQVYLQLPHGGSVILHLFANRLIDERARTYWQRDGPPVNLSGEWHVKFIRGGPVLPLPFKTAKLESWTARSDTNVQRFACTARYSLTFDVSENREGRYFLDLGEVCQNARVSLNGHRLGTLLTPPFEAPVELKPSDNRLVIEVTNVSANRIRDLDRRHVKWKIFHGINFVNINYRPFNAANWPLYDSGLLGPVTVTPIRILKP